MSFPEKRGKKKRARRRQQLYWCVELLNILCIWRRPLLIRAATKALLITLTPTTLLSLEEQSKVNDPKVEVELIYIDTLNSKYVNKPITRAQLQS